MIHLLMIEDNSVFYDLGSGIGKAVIQVAMQTNVKKSVGIELSETRYNISKVAAKDVCMAIRTFTPAEQAMITVRKDITQLEQSIHFVNNDILDTDISDATCIYWNNICFNAIASYKILEKFNGLPEGTRILCSRKLCGRHSAVCLRKDSPCSYMSLVHRDKVSCTWAEACTVFIYLVTKKHVKNWWDQ